MLIAHASDSTGDDAPAFLHAAALARTGSRLVTVHAGADHGALSPGAAELAARWGRPIDHELLRIEADDDPAESVIETLRQLQPALVVVGTHARHGLAALMRGSVAETIARNLEVPVLVVPNHARGFVDPRNGTVDLRRIVIPAGNADDARRGADAARSFARIAGSAAELEIVHAGPLDPELEQLGLTVTRIDGSIEDAILAATHAHPACLIVMPTRGHDGVGDALRGSRTEHVIREASCPVLSVPM
jgi:nucleotide-binding universal stress UspA family protein